MQNSASQTAEDLEALKINSENSSTVKDTATADNDWVSFDWEVKLRLPLMTRVAERRFAVICS